MKLEKQKEALVMTVGEENTSSIDTSLDLDSAQILMQMLSKNLYSDPIGSTIRECTSNALDSHKRINSNNPVIVTLEKGENKNLNFCVEDFGTGLDNIDVEEIISKYGKSTKRNSNTELGMMGLGFKAPLAYSSSFYFICRKGGIERKYMMYEGEDNNKIDLLYESETKEINGVKIIIPVKTTDGMIFYKKIKEQLCYFENVYFNISDEITSLYKGFDNNYLHKNLTITNNFKILRTDLYQYSELYEGNLLHLCLGDVYYPIDFEKLGIRPINIPIGLKFSLEDGIYPIPSRESIKYSVDVKKKILDRIKKLSDYLTNEYNKISNQEIEDLSVIYKYFINRNYTLKVHDILSINFTEIQQYSDIAIIQPKLKNVKHLSLYTVFQSQPDILIKYISSNYKIQNNRFTSIKNGGHQKSLYISDLLNNDCILYEDSKTELTPIMRVYLKSLYENKKPYDVVKIIKIQNDSEQEYLDYIIKTLKLDISDYKDELIKEILFLRNLLLQKAKNIKDIKIPQSFIDEYNATNKKNSKIKSTRNKKATGHVYAKITTDLKRYSYESLCKFENIVINLDKIEKRFKKLVIYSSYEDDKKIANLYFLKQSFDIELITFSERDIKKFKDLNLPKNFISYNEFIKGNNNVFKRFSTSLLIKEVRTLHAASFNNPLYLSDKLQWLKDDIIFVNTYFNKYYKNSNSNIKTKVSEEFLKIAIDNNKFDEKIIDIIYNIDNFLNKHQFINLLLKGANSIGTNGVNLILEELCRKNKIKMNKEIYCKQLINN